MDKEPVLVGLRGVKKSYKKGKEEIVVLDDISLNIRRGSFTVLSGLSGAGKTTLLKVIGGFEPVSAGKVMFGEEEISSFNDARLTAFRRKNVGMIFQDYFLDKNLTFRGNIELPAMFAGLSKEEMAARTQELVKGTDLAERLNHYPEEVSGGQAQRAAILRAIYLKPDLILADEPTSNIDDLNAKAVLDYLKELQQAGHTILVASHDARVLSYADGIVRLANGRLV